MTTQGIIAVITSAAGLVTAVAALVRQLRHERSAAHGARGEQTKQSV